MKLDNLDSRPGKYLPTIRDCLAFSQVKSTLNYNDV